MGVVYLAEDTRLKRTVALKFLPLHLNTDEEAKQRFVQEAQSASALNHPNICTIHEIGQAETAPGESGGQMFIAMAHYSGETLKEKLGQGPVPVAEAVRISQQISDGLAAAHEHGIVHRDIKPANIIVTEDGRAVILDFGLAKLTGAVDLTQTGSTLGTIAYMSPEQVRGESLDPRTDLWSLGVCLFEMLTNSRPFKGDYDQAIAYSILNEEPPPVGTLREDVSIGTGEHCRHAAAQGAGESIPGCQRGGGHAHRGAFRFCRVIRTHVQSAHAFQPEVVGHWRCDSACHRLAIRSLKDGRRRHHRSYQDVAGDPRART